MNLFGRKSRDLVRRIEYRHFNERDVEIPALMEFLEARRGAFVSLLDAGAKYSHAYYAPLVRRSFRGVTYHGVDLVSDPETARIVDSYHVGNVADLDLGAYDVITCVSTIEHCGLTGDTCDDLAAERRRVFRRLSALARRSLFLTFPYGAEGMVAGEYANITRDELGRFISEIGGRARTSFYYNQFPQGREKWRRISEAEASDVPIRAERGVQCVCVLEIDKPDACYRGSFPGITNVLLETTKRLEPRAEYTSSSQHYSMFNTGGVEIETAEFLYAFVKLTKPRRILETGTHLGVSAMYMAKALDENGGEGRIDTLEIFDEHIRKAEALWRDTGVSRRITVHRTRSLEFQTGETYDILFLDSEPDIRFDEVIRYYPKLRPGGFIMIHDLHAHLGLSGQTVNGIQHWPFGDFREKFGRLLLDHSLQTLTFRTPRGLALFQKADDDFSHTQFLRESTGRAPRGEA